MKFLKKKPIFIVLLLASLLTGSCLVEIEYLPTRTPEPTAALPSETAVIPTFTPTLVPTAASTPIPTATPEPVTFTVGEGHDMFSIALFYGISLDELKAANPDVNPNAMGLGTVLIIPVDPLELETLFPEDPEPTLSWQGTVAIKDGAICHPAGIGGAYCLAEVVNLGEEPLENVSVLFQLFDQAGRISAEMTEFTPLNILGVDASLPVIAYFSEGVPEGGRVEVLIDFWLPTMPENDRYVQAEVTSQQIELDQEALLAKVSGEIAVPLEDRELASLWLLVVAYDQEGNPVGVRRWEADLPLTDLNEIPFETFVYSLAGAIDSIELLVEARLQNP